MRTTQKVEDKARAQSKTCATSIARVVVREPQHLAWRWKPKSRVVDRLVSKESGCWVLVLVEEDHLIELRLGLQVQMGEDHLDPEEVEVHWELKVEDRPCPEAGVRHSCLEEVEVRPCQEEALHMLEVEVAGKINRVHNQEVVVHLRKASVVVLQNRKAGVVVHHKRKAVVVVKVWRKRVLVVFV